MLGRPLKINSTLLEKIAWMLHEGYHQQDILKNLDISRTTGWRARCILNLRDEVDCEKTTCKITDLISLRLLCKCDDIKLLSQRLGFEIAQKKINEIYVQPRVKKIAYNKIIYLDKIIKKTGLKYKWQI